MWGPGWDWVEGCVCAWGAGIRMCACIIYMTVYILWHLDRTNKIYNTNNYIYSACSLESKIPQ